MRTQDLRDKMNDALSLKKELKRNIFAACTKLETLKDSLEHSSRSLYILQTVAKQTQEQLEYKISELVSLSLSAVFPNPYSLRLIYELKRNKTEAHLIFERDGKQAHPLDSSGYGPIDIASFALRCSLWSLRKNKLDNVLVIDEPFKNINDDTRRLHKNAARMVREVSDKLGLQMIITSQIPEMRDIADSVFEVRMKNGVSTVKEV